MNSHIEQYAADLKSAEPVGKRLNFILQEMNREANTIASKGPLAVAAAKECVNRGLEGSLSAGCDLEKASFGSICGTADKTEGCKAFMEKRKPVFNQNCG